MRRVRSGRTSGARRSFAALLITTLVAGWLVDASPKPADAIADPTPPPSCTTPPDLHDFVELGSDPGRLQTNGTSELALRAAWERSVENGCAYSGAFTFHSYSGTTPTFDWHPDVLRFAPATVGYGDGTDQTLSLSAAAGFSFPPQDFFYPNGQSQGSELTTATPTIVGWDRDQSHQAFCCITPSLGVAWRALQPDGAWGPWSFAPNFDGAPFTLDFSGCPNTDDTAYPFPPNYSCAAPLHWNQQVTTPYQVILEEPWFALADCKDPRVIGPDGGPGVGPCWGSGYAGVPIVVVPNLQLAITDVTFVPSQPKPRTNFEMDVTVKNATGVDVSSVKLDAPVFTRPNSTSSQPVATVVTPPSPAQADIAAGQSHTFSYQVVARRAGDLRVALTGSGTDAHGGKVGIPEFDQQVTVQCPDGDTSCAPLVVNSTGDSPDADPGHGGCDTGATVADGKPECTLRAAIMESDARNAAGGASEIDFDIPGGGTPTIQPASVLPDVTGTTTIDATTQPGGWVQLSGASAGAVDGLRLMGSASILQGLVISGFGAAIRDQLDNPSDGPAGVRLAGSGGHTVVGNRIGTSPDGSAAVPNRVGILVDSSANTIGSPGAHQPTCSGDCNVVSGNRRQIEVRSGEHNQVAGDFVGLVPSGAETPSGADFRSEGVVVEDAAGGAQIGGGNVLAGNLRSQVDLRGSGSTVTGNLIGLGADGQSLSPLSEQDFGVVVRGPGNTIGGPADTDRNVISGVVGPDNPDGATVVAGVLVDVDPRSGINSNPSGTTVEGNYVGTTLTGDAARGNAVGILIGPLHSGMSNPTASGTTIRDNVVSGNGNGIVNLNDTGATIAANKAGTDPGGEHAVPNGTGIQSLASVVGGPRPPGSTSCDDPCNLVSGNTYVGIAGSAAGNFVGTDLTGAQLIPNGVGIDVNDPNPETIGGDSGALAGTCDQACNLVAGNHYAGIAFGRVVSPGVIAGPGGDGSTVRGNVVGLNASGLVLGNVGPGVFLTGALTTGNMIEDNLISGNAGEGILASRDTFAGLSGDPAANTFRNNSIFGNGRLAIDLSTKGGLQGDGPTPNDSNEDLDTGPNGLQNKPDLALSWQANGPGSAVTVGGTFEKPSNDLFDTFTLEFFGNFLCNSSGYGDAQIPLGTSTAVNIDGTFRVDLPNVPASVHGITATVTDAQGDTSEISDCVGVNTATNLTAQANAGATELQVASTSGFQIGDEVRVDPGFANQETGHVIGFGSLVVDPPLQHSHAVDAVVTRVDGPTTSIDSGPADGAHVDSSAASFAFSSPSAGAVFECRLDAADWSPCTSPASHTGLTDGTHTFSVRAHVVDGPVDLAPPSSTWVVDTVPPDITITTPADGATFLEGATVIPVYSCTDSLSPPATCVTTPMDTTTVGPKTFTVTATDQAGNTRTASVGYTVVQAPVITSANHTAFTVGSAGTFSVTTTGSPTPALSETGALPSGVAFTDNGNGTATLSGTPAAGTAGAYPLTIKAANGVAPDATQSFTLTVRQATTTSLSSSAATVALGGSVKFTATVHPASGGTPTGTVTFADGGTTLGSAPLNGGIASFTTSSLLGGSHTITATYGGDAAFGPSTSAGLTETVGRIRSATALVATPNPSQLHQAVSLTATVTAAHGAPTGTVTFKDGTAVLGTSILDGGGHATLTTSALSIGKHSLTAAYSGDGNLLASASSALSQTVGKAASSTSVASSANPAPFGTPVTLTATVTSPGGTPTGTVTFKNGTTTLGTRTLDGTGRAQITTSALTKATNPISAAYGGDANFAAGTAALFDQHLAYVPSIATVVSSANPVDAPKSVTFTATISSPGGSPTGAVTFFDGTTALGPAVAVNSTGHAALTAPLPGGGHLITVSYGGDASFAASSSPVLFERVKQAGAASTETALTSSPDPSTSGQLVTFTATVKSAAGTPNGTVSFIDNGVVLGTMALDGSGHTTLSISSLSKGSNSMVVAYLGSAGFNPSISAPLIQTVN